MVAKVVEEKDPGHGPWGEDQDRGEPGRLQAHGALHRHTAGGPPGGTGLDGSNHRPWRRASEGNPPSTRAEGPARSNPTTRAETAASSKEHGGAPRSSGVAGPSRGGRPSGVGVGTPVLPEPFEEHAWHVLLNMTDPHSVPEQLAYGLTSTATECVQASFKGMTARERERMHIALLRVLSRILMDVARAMAAAMMETQGDMIDVELEEGDHTTLMQGLPEHKAKKLKAASDKKEVTVPLTLDDILGLEFHKLSNVAIGSHAGKPPQVIPRGAKVIDLNDSQSYPEQGLPAPLVTCQEPGAVEAVATVPGKETDGHVGGRVGTGMAAYSDGELKEMRAAMERVCEEHKAAAYRDRENWELSHAISSCSSSPLLEVQIRGGVRHAGGGRGTTQSMMFYVDPSKGNMQVDLQFNVGSSSGTLTGFRNHKQRGLGWRWATRLIQPKGAAADGGKGCRGP